MNENLYELVGGQQTIKAATERFYERVMQDERLRQFFEHTDIATLRSRQVMFISMLLGGRVYTGKEIHAAHAAVREHGLTAAQFDLSLDHFRAALQEVGVKPENAEKMMKILEGKRKAVLEA